MNKPICAFLCGLPGSGKSTWANANKDKLNAVIHSSDAIRDQLGDINDQSKNELVFKILHNRVKEDLLCGQNVIVDATGLNRKKRKYFIDYVLRNVPCEKVCVLFATPIISCRKNNRNRDRQVPDDVITRMVKSFNVPCKQEGWDEIQIIWWDYAKDNLVFDFNKNIVNWQRISHDSPHHEFSIGDHMIAAYEYMCTQTTDIPLILGAYMHDCGKPITKGFVDSKGEPCTIAHYYNHENVSSYMSLFYLKEFFSHGLYSAMADGYKFTDEEILHIALLIELHMRPWSAWKQSNKAKEKDRRLYGDDIIKELELLNDADRAAH